MDNPDRLQRRAFMVATLLRKMALAPEFFDQVVRLGQWNPGYAIQEVGVGGLPAPIALNPLTELHAAVERIVSMLKVNPNGIQLLRNLGVELFGLVIDSQPHLHRHQNVASGLNANPNVTGVSQTTLEAIEVIGKLLLDARSMLMLQKICPVNICGNHAPITLPSNNGSAFTLVAPAAQEPLQPTPFNIAMADFFGATNTVQQTWTDKDFEPIRKILMEQVLRENGNFQDLGAEMAQPAEPLIGTEDLEAQEPRAATVQLERRRAQSAPPGLIYEFQVALVVGPVANAEPLSPTVSVDAVQGSPNRSVSGATTPTELALGTSSEGQGNHEGLRTSTPVAQQGSSDAEKLTATADGSLLKGESTSSTMNNGVIPVSADSPVVPVPQNNDQSEFRIVTEGGDSFIQSSASLGEKSMGIDAEGGAEESETGPINAEKPPAGIEQAADQGQPMEVDLDDQNVDHESELSVPNRSVSNGSTTNDASVPVSSDRSVSPKIVEDVGPIGEKGFPVVEAAQKKETNKDSEGSGTVPIDDEGTPIGVPPVIDQKMPMEADQDNQLGVNGSSVLKYALNDPTSVAVVTPDSSEQSVSQKDVGLAMGNRKEDGSSLQKMEQNGTTISSPVGGTSTDLNGGTEEPATDPTIANGTPEDIEATVDHGEPMEIDQDDQNEVKGSTVPVAVTNTVLPNNSDSADASSFSDGQGSSNNLDVQNVIAPVSGSQAPLLSSPGQSGHGSPIPLLPAHGLPVQGLPMPGSMPLANQFPVSITTPKRGDHGRTSSPSSDQSSSTRPAGVFTRSRSRSQISLSSSPNANQNAVRSTDNGTNQDSSRRRKQREPRRYSPSSSAQNAVAQTDPNREQPRKSRKRPAPASGSSRAARNSRSRSPLVRQPSHSTPTYQKITKDREAHFQWKKNIFMATRGLELQPATNIYDRKLAEAEMHCAGSVVYNHPKLKQILPHLHTMLYDANTTGPLPQIKKVKEVKPDELFHKWNWEVNKKTNKTEWKQLIKTNDPAYSEWWQLAAKVDEEQVEQMEMGWITGLGKDLGIGNETQDAGPSGRVYPIREFSPEL